MTLFLMACEKDPGFTILSETEEFQQTKVGFNNKLDILWVVDNSGSMGPNQDNVAANFEAFIADFINKGFDYQIAVTTTEAWLVDYPGHPFYDPGIELYSNFAGTQLITPLTPDPEQAFIDNITQGVSGYGDERAFDSFVRSLSAQENIDLGFPRADAFLAIIIVSDEDDFSHSTDEYIFNNHDFAGLRPISEYTDFLDNLTQSSGASRRYNVSSIAILDSDCEADNAPHGVIAQRYQALANETNGELGDVCAANFSDSLNLIQSKISELSTQFFLTRTPVDGSIVVKVNSQTVPEDPINGWTYDEAANSIVFNGSAVPVQGSTIIIDYDPTTVIIN